MLVFFMVAGTLTPPVDPQLKLVRTADLEGVEPESALVILPSGDLQFRGHVVQGVGLYMESIQRDPLLVARLMPDQDAPATVVVTVAHDLRTAGAKRVVMVSEKFRR